MTAFLEKLRRICATCPPEVAGWSQDGFEFEVRSKEFEAFLKNYFKGTLKTFIRQLHFYGFTKSESVQGRWSFSHPKFNKFNPDAVLEITRKTRMHSVSFATKDEVEKLRREVRAMKHTLHTEVANLKQQLALISKALKEDKLESHRFVPSVRKQTESMNEYGRLATRPMPEFAASHIPARSLSIKGSGKRRFSTSSTSTLDLSFNLLPPVSREYSYPSAKKPKTLDPGFEGESERRQGSYFKATTTDKLSERETFDKDSLDFSFEGFALPVNDLTLDAMQNRERLDWG